MKKPSVTLCIFIAISYLCVTKHTNAEKKQRGKLLGTQYFDYICRVEKK
jgi:hypothetical protein